MLIHPSRPALFTLPLLAVLTGAGCDIQVGDKGVSVDVSEGRSTEEWVRQYTLPAGGELEIVNVNGRIEVEAASGPSVEVRAERTASGRTEDESRQMLRDNPMQEEVGPNRVRVEAVSDGGREARFGRRTRVQVEFTVRVPPGLRLTLTTENGGIRIEDVAAQVTASTTNGGIDATGLSGGAIAKTINGGIRIEMTAVTSDIDISITNGGARLELPPGVKATLDARCVNGGISVDDDLSFQATEMSRERVVGTLNGGGQRISATAVNGGIRIRANDFGPGGMNEDKATRYHRLRRRTSLLGSALGVALLLTLLVTHGSAFLRDFAIALTGGSTVAAVVVYVVLFALINEAVQLPVAVYHGVILERRYGLSTQPAGHWWSDHVKSSGVILVLGLAASLVVWGLMRWDPQTWWVSAAALFALVLVGLAQLAPIILLPLFYQFAPLQREDLVRRLTALAARAHTPVLGVYEWRLSDRTTKANAALTGIGRTRRILVSDTLLAAHSDEEVEVILAHELAHHVHNDIWRGLAIEVAIIAAAFYFVDRVLIVAGHAFGLAGKGDIAALPLALLAAGAVSLAFVPMLNMLSRKHERRADRYALQMTSNAEAFVSAMRRLGAQNLAEERPSTLVKVLFHTHPPLEERIAAARSWAATRSSAGAQSPGAASPADAC